MSAQTDPRRPTFYLIGAAKSGTTTLAQHLRGHPDLFLTDPKEPNFFADDAQYGEGLMRYLERYYGSAAGFAARGEATPGYFHRGGEVAPRIAALHPEAPPRLILLLRHPITRSYSHYRHRHRTAEESASFEEAMRRDGSVYFSDSLYGAQLAPWIETFGREALLILRLEELAEDPAPVLAQVWTHLGLAAPQAAAEALHANVAAEAKSKLLMRAINARGPHKRLLRKLLPSHLRRQLITRLRNANIRAAAPQQGPSDKIVEELLERFAPDLEVLEALSGLRFDAWRQAPEAVASVAKGQVGVR